MVDPAKVGIGQAEGAHVVGHYRFEFGGAMADLGVLHQDNPSSLADVVEPFLVVEALPDALSVDVGHRVNGRAGRAKRLRHDISAEAAIDEDSGCESEGNADDILDLGRGHSEVAGYLRETVAGLEPVDEVLHASAAVHDDWLAECLLWIDDHFG